MTKRKLYASGIAYLDPLDCGSSIGYVVCRGRRGLYGDVHLTDCDRKIAWYFSKDAKSIAKIDKAIEILNQFREEFVKASRRRKLK